MEVEIGRIAHYFSHIGVAVADITNGKLNIGDSIHIKGHVTDFVQNVESMQVEHQSIETAKSGESVGLKVNEHVRENDVVYKVS